MSTELEEKIRTEVARVITNNNSWPLRVGIAMLGVDLSEPIDKLTAALMPVITEAQIDEVTKYAEREMPVIKVEFTNQQIFDYVIREARADAWDESRAASDREWSEITAGVSAHDMGTAEETPNPYRSNDE